MAIVTTSANLNAYVATSSTSFDTSVANKTLTIDTGKAFYAGQFITVTAVGALLPTRLRGSVVSYDPGTGAMQFSSTAIQWVESDNVSVTSLTIGTGSKTLTINPNLTLTSGDPVRIQQISNLGRWMTGTVTSYNSTTGALVANITAVASSGTYTDWTVCSEGTFSDWQITYNQGDIIEIRNGATLTVSATPATRPGTVQCITSGKLRIENSSTTVPLIFDLHDMTHDLRFEAGGVLEIRGAPMSLGTGTGAAQTFDFTSLFGGVIRHMNYVEVEETAGSGVYMPWPVIQEDPKFNLNTGLLNTIGGADPSSFTAGNTEAGQVLFWHETNRTLRCGDNTSGKAIPNGCAIRIPNIYISNRLRTNETFAFNIQTSGTPTAGTFTLEISRENGLVLGTTAPIAFNAANTAVDTAIEAITGVGTVTPGGGPLPTAVSVTWAGAYANERLGVRVANNSLTGGTNPQVYVYENSAANSSLIDLSPSGTMDAEWVSFSDKFRFVTDVFKSVRLMNVGVGNEAFQLNNSNGSIEIDGVAHSKSPYALSSTGQFFSVLGDVSAKRMVFASKGFSGFNFNVLPAIGDIDRIYLTNYGQRTATSHRSIQFITLSSGIKITNLVAIGSSMLFQNLTNVTIANYKYADGCLNTQNALQSMNAVLTTNTVGCTFANYSDAGPMALRSYMVVTDTSSSNTKFLGAVTNLANNGAGPLLMQSGGATMLNYSVNNARSGPFIDMPSNYLANNLIAKKVFGTFATAQFTSGLDACQGGQYDMVTSTIAGITETFSGVNDWVGGNYTDPSLTPTTGHVTFGPFADGAGLTLTGAGYTDALGAFLLPTAGDTAVITMPFAMHGITSFQNVEPYLYIDSPGAAANVNIAQAPGVPTGGTFTLTISTAAGTLLGTTSAIAFNASSATTQTAVQAVVGAGNATVSGTSIGGGYTITGAATYAGQGLIVSVNGSALTGGTEPGVAYAYGRARLLTGTERLGSVTPVEFAVRVPGTVWPSYAALTGANLSGAIAALTGYAAGGSGLEMRIKVTATQTNPYTKFNQISIPTNVDPSLWTVGDATIHFEGPGATDTIHITRASDMVDIYTFTGGGLKEFTVGANFDVPVFFLRVDSSGVVLMRTLPATQKLNFGDNGTVSMFYGAEVQLAQSSEVLAIKTLVDAYLDAAISSRLPATAQTDITAIKSNTDLIPALL